MAKLTLSPYREKSKKKRPGVHSKCKTSRSKNSINYKKKIQRTRSMKESKLIEMQNKVKAMTNIIQQLINEVTHLRELSIGTLETIKLMPDYEDAIKALKKQMEDNIKEKQKAKQNGAIKQDTK